MGKFLTAVFLTFIIPMNVLPQAVIKNRSPQGYVNITGNTAATQYTASIIRARSASAPVNIIAEVPIKPPRLQADNPQLVDTDGNNYINANESARIFFTLRNTGDGPALNLEAKIAENNRVPGIAFQAKNIGTLQPGEVKTVEIPISADIKTTNSTASFSITVSEANGFGIDIGTMVVQTKAMLTPMVSITSIDYGGMPVRKNEKFNVSVIVQNSGQGVAENVTMSLPLTENVFLTDGNTSLSIGTLAPGESREVRYTLITNNNYTLSRVILPFVVAEKYGKYSDNGKSTVTIPMDLQLTANRQVVVQGEQAPVTESRPVTTASSFISDVDKDIPVVGSKNQNRVALIIGNEDYSRAFNPESNVDFASNDAKIFSEYAKKVLGIPDKYVLLSVDATYMVMKSQIQRAIEIVKVMGPAAELIFYYAGHGFPDQATRIPYLIPVDVSAANLTSAIKLADVYSQLSNSGAGRVTVFLDACFSGGGRDMGPVNARAVRMAPNTEENMISGNMIVFTASTGEQTAQALNREKHGLFTYYLLKKLKETAGNVTYSDLFEYILKNVQLDALTENNKPQVPVLISSELAGEKWKTWKLR
ncbi:MAG TPA: caspase family protein [Bacteroidales bacterium]|nr:caspase family protein [Bacteroidales bacterium]